MSGQLQASSSPTGEPPDTMSTDPIRVPDEENETPDSSQMELINLPAEVSNRQRNKDKRPDYKECCNSDSETQDATGEASLESEDAAEDIPACIMVPHVTTRSRAKKEAENSERATPHSARHSNTMKRSHGNHETETTRPAKRGRPSTANTVIKKFEKDSLGLVERFASSFRELETTRSENQELKKEVKLLKSALEQEQADRMQNELAQGEDIFRLQSECKRWRVKLESAIDELKKDSGKYIKVSDSEIKEDWMTLSYNVRDLVTQCLTENPADQNMTLKSLVMSHRLLSIHDISTLRACILRRTVWMNAILPVFSGRHSIWQGELGATLTQFLSTNNYNHIGDAKYLQIISQIKSRAAADLSDEGHLNIKAMEVLIDRVTKRLSPFIPKSNMELFEKGIKRLITEAVDLHSIMMKSKAIFLTLWLGDGDGKKLAPFDQTKMIPVQYRGIDASNSFVMFVEAPGLWKIGNADGEKFDTGMVLCESRVTLKEDNDDDDEKGDGKNGNDENGDEENGAGEIGEGEKGDRNES